MGLIDLIFKKQIESKSSFEDDIIENGEKKAKSKKVKDESFSKNYTESLTRNNFNNINVYSPKNMGEVEKIVINLKLKEASIINLKGFEKLDYIKILDFLNGATFALNGSISRLTADLYLISPEGVRIKTLK